MMTNYGDKWLGYSLLRSDLARAQSPQGDGVHAPDRRQLLRQPGAGVPPSALEWGTDTTRTIINMIFSGTSQKYKDISFIWSHGGGALSSVAERLLFQMVNTPSYKGKFTRESVQAELNRFYYDTAQVSLAGDACGAGQDRAGFADRLWHRFPVPDGGRSHQGRDRDVQRRRSQEGRSGKRVAVVATA